MVQSTPAKISQHLTEAVIDRAFKLRTNSEDSVQSVEVFRAAPAGEGLISAVYRIKVTGTTHSASFVVKGLVDKPIRKILKNSEFFFNREVFFFSKVLPILTEVQKSLGAKEKIQNSVPICYSNHCDGTDDYLLLEDLTESQCFSISENVTKNERNASLKVLAHLHAVSMATRIKKPDEFDEIANSLSEVYYSASNREWYARYLQNAIDIDLSALAEYENPSISVYYKKFLDLVTKDVFGQLMNICSTRGNHAVFGHGDAWLPNFLCSKERAVAIDFQLLRCASPATDLTYLIILSGKLCQTKEDFLEAVEGYYSSLCYYLKDMGMDAGATFSWEDLNEELKMYGKYGFLASLSSIPLICSEKCDVLESFEQKYPGKENVPLEELWVLTPLTGVDSKMKLVNAVRVAVDVGLI